MLTQIDRDNFEKVIFLRKDDCALWANIAQVIFWYNVVSDVFGQHWREDIIRSLFILGLKPTPYKIIDLLKILIKIYFVLTKFILE